MYCVIYSEKESYQKDYTTKYTIAGSLEEALNKILKKYICIRNGPSFYVDETDIGFYTALECTNEVNLGVLLDLWDNIKAKRIVELQKEVDIKNNEEYKLREEKMKKEREKTEYNMYLRLKEKYQNVDIS